MQHKRTPATLKVVVSGVVSIADPAAVVAVDPTQSSQVASSKNGDHQSQANDSKPTQNAMLPPTVAKNSIRCMRSFDHQSQANYSKLTQNAMLAPASEN